MPTLFITGANRGIGLEFVRQYAADGWRIVAAVRNPATAQELKAIDGDIVVRKLDLEGDFFEIEWAALAGSAPIDLLIANAGTWGPAGIDTVEDAAGWLNALAVNSVAPVMLARTMLPNVAAAGGKLIAITSKMGSISDNGSGGAIAYRSSKAALNAAWRSLAIEVKPQGVAAAVLHPGWVQTRMGGAGAPLTPQQSVSGLRQVIAGLTLEKSGGFFDYDGTSIPW